jgi:hypothetical protein
MTASGTARRGARSLGLAVRRRSSWMMGEEADAAEVRFGGVSNTHAISHTLAHGPLPNSAKHTCEHVTIATVSGVVAICGSDTREPVAIVRAVAIVVAVGGHDGQIQLNIHLALSPKNPLDHHMWASVCPCCCGIHAGSKLRTDYVPSQCI